MIMQTLLRQDKQQRLCNFWNCINVEKQGIKRWKKREKLTCSSGMKVSFFFSRKVILELNHAKLTIRLRGRVFPRVKFSKAKL